MDKHKYSVLSLYFSNALELNFYSDTLFAFVAPFNRPMPTKEMKACSDAILDLPYGVMSFSFLLSKENLRKCQLIGADQSIADWLNEKYDKWEVDPIPDLITSPIARTRCFMPLNVDLASLEYTPKGTDEPEMNFFNWANVDLTVHRLDSYLRGRRYLYDIGQFWSGIKFQYGTSAYEDFFMLSPTVPMIPLPLDLSFRPPSPS